VRCPLDLAGGAPGAIGAGQMSRLVLPPVNKSIGLSALNGRKPQSLLEAAQHNRRHPDGRGWRHKSDPAKIHLNQCLQGPDTCEGVVALQEGMMASVGYTPKRRDYSQAFELLFTAPPDLTIDHRKYLAWCLEWTHANLGRDIVLSADSHFDEGKDGKAPHLHILVAPISDGKWVGNTLTSGKAWPKLQAKFGRDLELKFDLKLMPQLKGKALTEAAKAVKKGLTERLERHIDPDLLQALLKLAGRSPSGLMGPLGLAPRAAGDGGAAFRRIALSPGKGGKKERTSNPYGIEPKPYGIEIDQDKAIPLFCSGMATEAPPQPTTPTLAPPPGQHCDDVDQPLTSTPNADGEIAPPTHTEVHDDRPDVADDTSVVEAVDVPFVELITRHHDCDLDPARFDDSGDYRPARPPAPRRHQQAVDAALTALASKRNIAHKGRGAAPGRH
jgi:hypothetical protein